MTKTILITAMAATFLFAAAGVGLAKFTCKVESVEAGKVVLDCDAEKASKIKSGDEVDITKKRKKLEGC
ncbi:MAG: hypothetical protein AB1568_14685 [Thermodesulfobacteriota bacterium]